MALHAHVRPVYGTKTSKKVSDRRQIQVCPSGERSYMGVTTQQLNWTENWIFEANTKIDNIVSKNKLYTNKSQFFIRTP